MSQKLEIRTLVVGQLQTNCYLIIDRESSESLIIDPGDDAGYIMQVISDEKVRPVKIIATHGHFDHILAALELQLAYNIPFLIHRKDEFLLSRMNQSAEYFTGVKEGMPPEIKSYLTIDQQIIIGNTIFKVVGTPGHTPGSVSFYNKRENLIFCGDLIFAGGGVGRTDFKYSQAHALQASISKILKLPNETKIYPGHGLPTTIGIEKEYHLKHTS